MWYFQHKNIFFRLPWHVTRLRILQRICCDVFFVCLQFELQSYWYLLTVNSKDDGTEQSNIFHMFIHLKQWYCQCLKWNWIKLLIFSPTIVKHLKWYQIYKKTRPLLGRTPANFTARRLRGNVRALLFSLPSHTEAMPKYFGKVQSGSLSCYDW